MAKNEEQNLIEETARLYQSIARNSMDGFCIIDPKGHFFDVNDTYCRLMGYSKNEFLEMNLADVEAKDKPKDVAKRIQLLKRIGKERYFTEQRKKNGTIIDFEVSANYTNYLGGLIFVYLRDITEIKKTENDQYRNRAKSRKEIEGQLADSYKYSKDQAESRKVIEGQLADSYKHSEDQAESKKVLEGQLADSYKQSEDQAESKKVLEGQLADSYRHSKNRAKSRKVIKGQLADSYRHSKNRAKSRKVIEGQLADSYKYSEDQAESRKVAEGQLADSYKHLGTINRKISLLFELSQYPKSKNDKQKILDHILNLAMTISNAPTGYLYQSKGKGEFDLLSSKGLNGGEIEKIKMISVRTVKLLRQLIKKKKLISGNIKQYEVGRLALDDKLEYFVALPLSKRTSLGGFIFLGFDKNNSVDSQDLEFLEVFAMHASNALAQAGVLK